MIPDEAALRAGVLFANTATTLRYTGKPGEMRYAEGEICAVCRPGAEIPEGTAFYIDNYTYKILKNCTANASEEIKVRSTDPSRECENWQKPEKYGLWKIVPQELSEYQMPNLFKLKNNRDNYKRTFSGFLVWKRQSKTGCQ